jgi:hypothetical protein
MSNNSKNGWSTPAALALPKRDTLRKKRSLWTNIPPDSRKLWLYYYCEVKPGREEAIREYGKTIEAAVKANPEFLGPLKLHYLRWFCLM